MFICGYLYTLVRFSDRPARVKAASLNLIGVMGASSFDAPMHTVNALTEELVHIRFSVHALTDRAAIDAQDIGALLMVVLSRNTDVVRMRHYWGVWRLRILAPSRTDNSREWMRI